MQVWLYQKQKWKNPLWIAENRDATWLKRWEKEGKPDLEKRYKQDLANCEDIYFDLPNTTISSYYNLKDTYYMNIGTHGFYLLGHSDPAKINKETPFPEFTPNSILHLAQFSNLPVYKEYSPGPIDC